MRKCGNILPDGTYPCTKPAGHSGPCNGDGRERVLTEIDFPPGSQEGITLSESPVEPKPNIDDVCEAFHDFEMDCKRAHVHHSFLSEGYTKAIAESKTKLLQALTKLGLAKHIDWTIRP